jgi:hypothetical protein
VAWFCTIAIIIPTGFFIDHSLTASTQWILAVFVWWLLIGAMSTRNRSGKVLLLTLVAIATLCEFLASIVFHWYIYRLHNIPPWIPPAHGLIFFTALLWSEQEFAVTHEWLLKIMVTVGAIMYGLMGLFDGHNDVAGACYGALFLVWLWLTGRAKGRFYTALWFYVCYLEAWGVMLGAWHWAATVPVVGWREASPPSGIVGAYGLFDLIAFAIMTGVTMYGKADAKILPWHVGVFGIGAKVRKPKGDS